MHKTALFCPSVQLVRISFYRSIILWMQFYFVLISLYFYGPFSFNSCQCFSVQLGLFSLSSRLDCVPVSLQMITLLKKSYAYEEKWFPHVLSWLSFSVPVPIKSCMSIETTRSVHLHLTFSFVLAASKSIHNRIDNCWQWSRHDNAVGVSNLTVNNNNKNQQSSYSLLKNRLMWYFRKISCMLKPFFTSKRYRFVDLSPPIPIESTQIVHNFKQNFHFRQRFRVPSYFQCSHHRKTLGVIILSVSENSVQRRRRQHTN